MVASVLAAASAAAPLADSSSSGGILWIILLCIVGIPLECAAILFPIVEFWRGERPFGLRPGPIAAVRKGNVVLCGTVEPAWSVLTSPFSRKVCVWYRAKSGWRVYTGRGSFDSTVFRETNAIPFVLNDGTGRILVLGRRARWDNEADKRVDGDTRGMEPHRRTGPHQPPPPPILTWSMEGVPRERIDAAGTDEVVLVGERVTVVGRAVPYRQSATAATDACLDGGRSLGMPGEFIVGPRSLAVGLDVLVGTPRQIRRNARVGIAVGLAGAASLAATFYIVMTATAT